MKTFSRSFHLYRYQINPTVESWQPDVFGEGIKSIAELKSKKNEIFISALKDIPQFFHPRAELTHKLFPFDNFLVLKLGANRSLIRTTKEFEEEILDNWPSVYVVINNDPNIQMMAVEIDFKVFYRTSTVVNILSTNLNDELQKNKLWLDIKPTFYKNEFWKIVNQHKNHVTKAEFYMVAPNLSNISDKLELDLGAIKNHTNSQNTNMTLESPKGESLTLTEDDSFTNSLVHYASEGGGTIHLKIKNIRKKIKTEDSIKTTEIDEIYFEGDNVPAQLVEQLRKALE